ncbi:Inosine-5\'-monophosphate dehydrogenase (IMPDH/GuaB) [Mycoplasma suis KI3806]|uniref:Inosine-5\'-monophosphate dehydrogenase (IMPDH/GuaB) n=1 Tax=Mycoplasma suis (strain KI_3806) TaxID=708248 RepID=F0V1H9_MYCS3|nr:IMP dehydrogenase [Mycoplasma suis]CBZ40510.1 Inosine-5\'-monophosphate dehydrogenase (IMPDH/GuaB) [Mycoplasma suis KI3806]
MSAEQGNNKLLPNLSLGLEDVLIVPGYSDFLPYEVSLEVKLNNEMKVSLPFLSAAMDTVTEIDMARALLSVGAIGVLHRNLNISTVVEWITQLKSEFGENKPYAVAVGVSTPEEDIKSLVNCGVNMILIDSAHGHSKNIGEKIKEIREIAPDLFIIAGNVVSAEGAEYLISCGVQAVKVGLGSGSICTTRLITGVGSGEFSSLVEVSRVCKAAGVLTIADGGLTSPDEIVKALAAGVDLVMLGYLFAGTDEAPGEKKIIDGKELKLYRGMGSLGAMKAGSADRYSKHSTDPKNWVSEGVESYVRYKGSVDSVLSYLKASLQTAFGYIGAKNINELHQKAKFVRVTKSVSKKSQVHAVETILNF